MGLMSQQLCDGLAIFLKPAFGRLIGQSIVSVDEFSINLS